MSTGLILGVVIPFLQIQLYWCLCNARDAVAIGGFFLYLVNHGGETWDHSWVTPAICINSSLIYICRQYSLHLLETSTAWGICAIAATVTNILLSSYSVVRHYARVKTKLSWEPPDYACLFFGIIIVLNYAYIFVLALVFGGQPVRELTATFVVSYNYITHVAGIIVYLVYDTLEQLQTTISDLAVMEEKSRFVRYVSHEVRTPLQVMAIAFQLVNGTLIIAHREAILAFRTLTKQSCGRRRDFALAVCSDVEINSLLSECDIIEEVCLEAKRACDTSTTILNNLLTFNGDIMNMDRKLYDAKAVIIDAVDIFHMQARAAEIVLTVEYVDGLQLHGMSPMIYVDLPKIKQVIGNMISNALKFSPRQSTVTITCSIIEPLPSSYGPDMGELDTHLESQGGGHVSKGRYIGQRWPFCAFFLF